MYKVNFYEPEKSRGEKLLSQAKVTDPMEGRRKIGSK